MSTPVYPDSVSTRALAAAIAEANARPDKPTIVFLADGPRDLASIEARARTMAPEVSTGPRPLRMGPEAPLSIAPSPASTDAPPSESEIEAVQS